MHGTRYRTWRSAAVRCRFRPAIRFIVPFSSASGHKTLRRSRDFARQRWPFGQHKIAVCRVAPTAAPRISRVHLPMAVPFGLGPRRGICLYHRRCGAISFRQTRAPFGPHSARRICAGDPGALNPATLLPSSPTNCRKSILKWLKLVGPIQREHATPAQPTLFRGGKIFTINHSHGNVQLDMHWTFHLRIGHRV